MKNNLMLNTVRSVKKAPGRFFAIMAIIAISCAFYSGIKAASEDMKNSAWGYYSENALADIQIKSTLGFNDTDVDTLLENEQFESGYAGYSADLLIDNEDGRYAVKVHSYSPDYPLNKLYLKEGRLPEKSGECVADAVTRRKQTYAVGDKIKFTVDGEDDISNYLDVTEYTVVGLVQSPLYVTFERGLTTIGTGSLNSFIYIPEDDFSYSAYTDIYMSVTGAMDDSVEPFSDEYLDIVNNAEYVLENSASSMLDIRAVDIRDEADEELADAREKLADGQKKYDDGYAKYQNGLNEYNDAYETFSDNREQLEAAEQEYSDALVTYDDNLVKLENLKESSVIIGEYLDTYSNSCLKVLPEALLEDCRALQQIYDDNMIDTNIDDLLAIYIITDPEKDPQTKLTAQATIKVINDQVAAGSDSAIAQLKAQQPVLEETRKQLDESKETLDKYETELKDAKHELDDGKKELDDAQAQIDEANTEIADAQADLDKMLSDSEWYVWNRDEYNPGCLSYGTDAERIDSIASVFPIFFILIAALVCCTTMSRMVEEQRIETGTLRALGYSSGTVVMQYILYAVLASVIGSAIGTVIGFRLFPNIIYICYQSMYNYPEFHTPYMPMFALGCLGVSILCTTLSAVYTSVRELNDVPAQLIRPKPPKQGRRIFLERIGFIWKHMKFTSKITFRNLLRYKSRFFMMIVGIGGCTALLLTAFGLKEAIACIADKQYEEIFLYDAIAIVGDNTSDDEFAEIDEVISSYSEITSSTRVIQKSADVFSEKGSVDTYIFSPTETDTLSDYIVLRDRKSGAPITLEDGGAIINEKLAKMLDVSVGDMVSIDGAVEKIKISAITENYTLHYLYLTRSTYHELFGDTADNMIMINTGNTPDSASIDEISKALVTCDGIVSASFVYDTTVSFRKLVSSLNLIVGVIIIFAGALALVILYNLANININERIRELATIKVLGFFDSEVSAYVYRENIVSSIIGMLIGLVGGIFFERFVVSKAEVDAVMFSPDIPWYCFVLAVATMTVFTVLINILLYFRLKKIEMAASMKAIE